MTLYEKFFKNKDTEFKKNIQKWIFLKAQTFLLQEKPFKDRTEINEKNSAPKSPLKFAHYSPKKSLGINKPKQKNLFS